MQYTVCDILRRHENGAMADHVAIVDGSRRLTYGMLLERACRFAMLLREHDVARGDRVAIFLRRSVEAVVALFGTYLAGGVAVVIHDVLRRTHVNHVLGHSGAALLVTDRRQLCRVGEPAIDARRILLVDETAMPDDACAPAPLIGRDLAMILYTSGSTGFPKGVMVSHANLLAGARIVSDYLHLTSNDVLISLLPFSFDYGLNQLLTALHSGGSLVIQRSTFPPDVCSTLARERVTGMAGVPGLWLQMTDDARSPFNQQPFPDLRYITNTGGRLPESVVRQIRKTHPHVQIYLMYGLTEAFRSTVLPPREVDARPTSIGRAIPDVEILVVDEAGRRCAAGEVGELVHRGATVTLGYWRDPESTARVFREHPCPLPGGERETVVFSGDLVTQDEDGWLYFVGRRDQLIKSQGVRVSLDEVELLVLESGLVTEAAAFAVNGDGAEEPSIVVAVVPRDGFREEELRAFAKREMPSYLWPRDIVQLAELPRTPSGKPDRIAIRGAYVERSG